MAIGASADVPVEAWPFVGRSAAVERLRRSLVGGRGAVVFGAPGIGKSALARHVALLDGTSTAEVSAADALGPRWHELCGALGSAEVALGAWSHLLPADIEDLEHLATADGWRVLAEHLRATSGAIRLLVEDAHWLDPASVVLLHHLVVGHRANVLVTARRDPPPSHPLTALWKDGHLERIDLEPLDADEVTQMVEAALGAAVEPSTAAHLYERTGGNPLLVRELVEEGVRVGSLQLLHGTWVETSTTRPGPRLVDLLADQVDALDPEDRQVVDVLAVAGTLDRDVLTRLAGDAAVEHVASLGIVRIERDETGHPTHLADRLVGEVHDARMPAGDKRALLSRVLDELDRRGNGGHRTGGADERDLVRTTSWRIELERPVELDVLLRAADVAMARNDFPTAERLARAAIAVDDGAPAIVRLGEAVRSQQRHRDAEAILAPLGGQLDDLDDDLRFRYANTRALALSTELGRLDEAIAVLESTIETMADDHARWRLEAHLSFLLADCGRLTAARPLAEARLANVTDDERTALTALVACGLGRTLGGRCLDTLELCDSMLPIALRHLDDRPEALGWIGAAQMLATYVRGDMAAATDLAGEIELLVADSPDPTVRAGALMFQALVASERGQLDAALRLVHQSAALHEIDNRRGYQAWCFAIASRVHSMRAEPDEARRALEAARASLWPSGQAFAAEVDVAELWVRTLSGDRVGAAATLDRALRWAQAEGMAIVELRLRHEAVRAGLPVCPHVEAFAPGPALDQSLWARAQAAHVTALVADDGPGLVSAGAAFAALGIHLTAAEAFAQGAGAHRRAGSATLATQAKQLGEAQRARCEHAATPALRFGELVAGLTERELDVTTRAAAGQANQEIAAALGISVRTAETHLQRAFAKLGVHRRRDLADVLDPRPPSEPSTA